MDMFGAAKAPPIDDTVDVEVTQALVISTATARERERAGAAGRIATVRQRDRSGLTEDSGKSVSPTAVAFKTSYKLHSIRRRSQIADGGHGLPLAARYRE
jgi:hypothetical protein